MQGQFGKDLVVDINIFTPEQIEKAKAAKSAEELLALAQEEGIELTDEQLNAVAGGGSDWSTAVKPNTKVYILRCDFCGYKGESSLPVSSFKCPQCGALTIYVD